MPTPRLAITTGEPAGIGPDITLLAAQRSWDAQLVALADSDVLAKRADELNLNVTLERFDASVAAQPHRPGTLLVQHIEAAAPVVAGTLDPANAPYVLTTLSTAVSGCQSGLYHAMVTAPVQKSVINDAGVAFSGHTEFLAQQTATQQVVMLLATDELRVAVATTHLPLRDVADAISADLLRDSLRIMHTDLRDKFGIAAPCIAVLGLNPHAGEGGHLGREEIDIIIPVLEALRTQGMSLLGPLPADTAFNPETLARADAYLAMYHDQGLPVLKYAGFGGAINITLGLPIIRTSVDHGTALELAGSGNAKPDSLFQALKIAQQLAGKRL